MSPKSVADKIDGIIISGNEYFTAQVEIVQASLYDRLVTILKGIDTDSDGYITQSAANRRVLGDAIDAIDQAFSDSSRYHQAVEQHLSTIPEIDALNEAYFKTISPGFLTNRVFIKSLQRDTLARMESQLLNDGLQAAIKTPLSDILTRNISIGGSYSGFLQEIRDFVIGNPDMEAKLLKYTRTYLTDALFQYSRSYQESVTADLGLDWYNYNGGIIADSREFCRDRSGGYFHRKEIESWADLEWQGKNAATTKSSIFILLGGWACRHVAIPLHESKVPKEWIERAKDLGFI